MNEDIIRAITKGKNRKSLYHFTRAANLESIAYFDALYSSGAAYPNPLGKRRTTMQETKINEHKFILNAHLRIADSVMDPDTDVHMFRAFLDQNVFLWPTLRSCQKMMGTYSFREPSEKFAILQFDSYSLLRDHYERVRLSKYDSGSMPRYPSRCSYRKTLRMFLPLEQFGISHDSLVPRIPSEIYEVLIGDKVSHLQRYLQAVYCTDPLDIPVPWRPYHQPWHEVTSHS